MYSARAIATLCRSCFSHERRRRCLRRWGAARQLPSKGDTKERALLRTDSWWWWWYGPLYHTRECVLPRALLHLIRVAEHPGTSSRRPRHPFPALMAGVSPGRVFVHTALKSHRPNFTELQLWNLDRLLHVCTREQARAALWDSTVFSTPAPQEIAAQPSRRTPCQ